MAKSFKKRYPGATKCFVNGDLKLWFCHSILVAHSAPFAAMLEKDYKEKDQVEIALPEDEFLGMEHVLRLWIPIPTETVPVNRQNVQLILPIADKYIMGDVIEKCKVVLGGEATLDNVEETLELSERYGLLEVVGKCFFKFVKYF